MKIAPTPVIPVPGHAPGKVTDALLAKPATYISINWDPSLFGRDRSAGFALAPAKDGSQALMAAWSGADFARDRVRADLSTGSEYERAVASVFANAVARNEAALAKLQSNYPMDAKYQPRNGTFDFVLDRPGITDDLRYVGLIDAAPAAIRDILSAATGFKKHF